MLERLAHRGPDDRGAVQVNGSWLGHRRLSIVDVGGGQQPLSTRDESAYLVGNGEVYNHAEVRAGLDDRELLTTSDNEVALHLIDERGTEGLAELSGMFAFVMAGRDGRFVAARDPVGIKPLYWARRDGAVRFASEMHAFDSEWQACVEPFPPGCAWTPEDGMARFASAVPAPLAPVTDPEALLEGTRETLIRAVEQQMMGDVNVGVFLLNLQRCDRVTMAHSVEARVPFLDRNVIDWALRIPPAEKQGEPEKRLLRESFAGWLPDELLWRTKGRVRRRQRRSRRAQPRGRDAVFAAERDAVTPALRTKEELAYYRVWREHLQGISAERTLSRFARA